MRSEADPGGTGSVLESSGCDSVAFQSGFLRLSEQPGWRIFRLLRLPGPTPTWVDGIELPLETGSCRPGPPQAWCLAPREWLLVQQPGVEMQPVADPAHRQNAGWYLNEVSDASTRFVLEGHAAPWLLAKLSGLDNLDGRRQRPYCARTLIGQVSAVIMSPAGAETNRFDLLVERSFARYLWERLCDAAPHADELARNHGELA